MEKVSIFLADWQVFFQEDIHFTLSNEENIDVVDEATNNEKALNFIEANPSTVSILNAEQSELSQGSKTVQRGIFGPVN